MKAGDVMTRVVTTVQPTATVAEAIRLMLEGHISGLPVVDVHGHLVGVITEGDFMRRAETGTEKRRPAWLEFLKDPGSLAEEFAQSHARHVGDVMTREPYTVTEGTSLADVVDLMEKHRIKRVPVTHGKNLIGLISRADLLRALANKLPPAETGVREDIEIYTALMRALRKQDWAPQYAVSFHVAAGIVTLHGGLSDDRQRTAIRIMAETVPGVKKVQDKMIVIQPMMVGLL